MHYKNLSLHNIEDVREVMWPPGIFKLQRMPEDVRLKLNEGAQGRGLATANSEIRFVCEGPFTIHLRSPNGENQFHIAYGSFLGRSYPISDCAIEVEAPEIMSKLHRDRLSEQPFDSRVVRVLLPNAEVEFVRLEAEGLRPPRPEEVPKKRLLCCGTSITQGGCATTPHLSYASLTARHLGCDLINLGLGGSFYAEQELADYVAGRQDWNVATIGISVNMVPCFEEEEFRKRVNYFINTVAAAHPEKPVICMTLFPYFNDLCGVPPENSRKAENFRVILREAFQNSSCGNLHLVEGADILDDVYGLTPDLIHPSDFGMFRMASNLADRLRPLL